VRTPLPHPTALHDSPWRSLIGRRKKRENELICRDLAQLSPSPHTTTPSRLLYLPSTRRLPHLMRARTVPGKGPKVLDGSNTGRCSLRRVALRRRTLHMRRFLPSYAVAASCPGDFLRLHGRIAPSVSMVRGICAWSDLGCVTVWWGLD
jgi:hypothetical protein